MAGSPQSRHFTEVDPSFDGFVNGSGIDFPFTFGLPFDARASPSGVGFMQISEAGYAGGYLILASPRCHRDIRPVI